MAHPFTEVERQLICKELGKKLVEYYEEAWTEGVRELFNRMARANMGKVTGYLDIATDTYAGLRKKSSDAFMVTFKARVRQSATLYFANLPDVANDALPIATKALESLAGKIPVPVVGSVVSKLIGLGGAKAASELRQRAFQRADEQLGGAGGGEVRPLFTTDEEARAFIEGAIAQYKTIGRYLQTIPPTITTFQDAITFPASVFKVQQAASSLNVALVQIRDYVESMQNRLDEVRKVYADYKTRLDTAMPAAVDAVLRGAYEAGVHKGTERLKANKPRPQVAPVLPPMTHPGAATLLASYVTYAMARGIYDAMSEPLPATRSRSGAMVGHPPRR